MGRIAFTTEAKKATTNYDYPKLKLKNGERARILLLEDPVMEYVHTLRAPQLINGQPVMETKKRRDDSEYQDYKMDFLSKPLCLGDESILDDKGSDPKNCPMCALAKENSDMTQAPVRRFAMHVVRYKTKPNGFDPITPFSVELLVWGFTDKIFNKIVDFKNEFGDLKRHDLTLGPCTNEAFQQFDVSISNKAAWQEDDSRRRLTAETFKENQIPDLSIACGTKKEPKWIEEDLNRIRENWAAATGIVAGAVDMTTPVGGSLSDGLGDLLNSNTKPKPILDDPFPATTGGDLDDLLGEVSPSKASATSVDDDLLGSIDSGSDDSDTTESKSDGDLDDLLGDLI